MAAIRNFGVDGDAGSGRSVRAWSPAMNKLYSCPRFDRCSAPVCPLASPDMTGTHLRGEEVCVYLREAVKPGGPERLRSSLSEHIAEGVLRAVPAAMSLAGDLGRRLRRASRQGSKVQATAIARRSRWVAASRDYE